MPFVSISFKEVKEPVDSGRPYLKSLTKEEGKKGKAKSAKAKKQKKSQSTKKKERRYTKRGIVKAPHRTRFLVVRVPNINEILPKRNYKSKRRTFS